MGLQGFMMIAMIIIAFALIAVVLVQGHTDSGIGSVFGGSDIYRTRRGSNAHRNHLRALGGDDLRIDSARDTGTVVR